MKKHLFCFLAIAFLSTASVAYCLDNPNEPVVSAEWLYHNLDNPAVFVLDIRKVEDYREGHIPKAVSLTYAAWRTMENNLDCQLPHKDELADTICSSGIHADTYVVIVGNSDTEKQRINTTRVAWTLKYAGVKRPAILDGGHKAWISKNYPLSTEWVKRPKSNYKCKWNENVVAKKDYVKHHLNNASIVDVRPEKLFRGEISDPMLKRKGHIPGAVNLPYYLVFKKDGTFEEIKKLKFLASTYAGDEKNKEIVVLCCNGQFASSWWFALSEMLGYVNTKIYDGSMEEWCGDKDAPLVQGR